MTVASPAEPFVELFRAAALAFADASDAVGGEAKPCSDATSYAAHAAITGAEKLLLLCRKFLVSQEARALSRGERPNAMPIVTSASFREAAEAAAAQIEVTSILGVAAGRIATTIRKWVSGQNITEAQMLGVQAESAGRAMKKRTR